MNKLCYLSALYLKTKLLVLGVRLDPSTIFPVDANKRRITLYATTVFDKTQDCPEDVLIPTKCDLKLIARIRSNPSSPLLLTYRNGSYVIVGDGNDVEVEMAKRHISRSEPFATQIGADTLGIIPSSHCFYFDSKDECRFCEIDGTFKNKVSSIKGSKKVRTAKQIANFLEETASDMGLRHMALTSGNLFSYDKTSEYFLDIKEAISDVCAARKFEQILITLIPPDDFTLIDRLAGGCFTKVYYPIEVYDPKRFKVICPGKEKFGYNKLLGALDHARLAFGDGNAYTNLVFGIQSRDAIRSKYDPGKEYDAAIAACTDLFGRGIIPAFTIYHYGGFNPIGPINLDVETTFKFALAWGELAVKSGVIKSQDVLFSLSTLSNTLFNDAFVYAQQLSSQERSIACQN